MDSFERTEAMNVPHIIRLQGPWKCALQSESGPDTSQVHCRDADGLQLFLADRKGPFTATRRFHRPPGLAAEASVKLVVKCQQVPSQIELNGQAFASIPPLEFDIRSQFQADNELVLGFEVGDRQYAGLLDLFQVRLEISEPS